MKNQKGMTLVEVILALALVSITATVFFRTASWGYSRLVDSKKYTVDSFSVQQEMENKVNELKNSDTGKAESITIFGKTIKGDLVEFDVKSPSSATAHGKYTAFVPRINITYQVPVVNSASIRIDGSIVNKVDLTVQSGGAYKINDLIKFKGSHVDGDRTNFLVNVYKWYISPEVPEGITDPTNVNSTAVRDFLKSNTSNFITIREWNAAKPETTLPHLYDDLGMIPNIEDPDPSSLTEAYEIFSFSEIKFDETKFATGETRPSRMTQIFRNRYLIYSVTPYSDIGKMGEEVFSNPVYIYAPKPEEPNPDT